MYKINFQNVDSSSKEDLITPVMEQQPSSVVHGQFLNQIRPGLIFGKKTTISTSARVPQDNIIICPDGRSQCASGKTCCLAPSGLYYCCPFQYGSCCSDGKHCCALGYTCNFDYTCKQTNVVCPNQQSTCPLSNTCCPLTNGDYVCCPLPNAVCCPNQRCCPSGYICTSDGKCYKRSLSGKQPTVGSPINGPIHALFVKHSTKNTATLIKKQTTNLKASAPQDRDIICPDGQSECESDNTCCESWSGGYDCCPELNAVCCSDGEHCCPTENTCCSSGCCPHPNAVCCSDGEHCCPEGFSCDLSSGECILQEGGSKSVPSPCPDGGGGTCFLGKQQPAIKLSRKVNVRKGEFL